MANIIIKADIFNESFRRKDLEDSLSSLMLIVYFIINDLFYRQPVYGLFTLAHGEERCTYLRMRMTIVVMMAARKTKPPKTPRAMIPPKTKTYVSEIAPFLRV